LWLRPGTPASPAPASGVNPFGDTGNSSVSGGSATAPAFSAETDTYVVSANAPSQTPLAATAGAGADAAAVASIRSYEQTAVAQFENAANSLSDEDKQSMGITAGRQESLDIDYQTYTAAHTVTIALAVTADTLGAHPNQYLKTFTYDSATGQALGLTDLFVPNSSYLQTLSTIARDSLPDVVPDGLADSDMISAGTVPSEANFATFAISGNSLLIFFPPYRVAPSAAGPITLSIPLSKLTSVLKPQYLP
jgi:hypothetical protein